MVWTPQRIVLIGFGRHDEAVVGSNIYPGMLGLLNSSGQLIPHNVPGGGGATIFATEEALRGGDITQVLPANYVAGFRRAAKGDRYLALLQNGQNIVAGTPLMSAGDGTLIANPGTDLFEITAPSSVITNTATETAFSNGTYNIPANFLQVGDVLHIRSKVTCVAVASAATQRIRLYITNATPTTTTLADSTALALVAADVVIFDLYLTIRSISASGTAVADGFLSYTIAGTATDADLNVASFTLDTTQIETLVIKALASAAATGNQIRLDEYQITLARPGQLNTMVLATDACNNSAGAGSSPIGPNSAAYLRVDVP